MAAASTATLGTSASAATASLEVERHLVRLVRKVATLLERVRGVVAMRLVCAVADRRLHSGLPVVFLAFFRAQLVLFAELERTEVLVELLLLGRVHFL